MGAIDWEYGTLEGFPHLDLAYYVLQTSDVIYRRAPLRAAEYAAKYLAQQPELGDLTDLEDRYLFQYPPPLRVVAGGLGGFGMRHYVKILLPVHARGCHRNSCAGYCLSDFSGQSAFLLKKEGGK